MKIAIPMDNKKGLEDTVAEHFGRASNFLIYDTKTKNFEIYPNPEVAGGKELPPDFLHRRKVETVIVFSLGPMAYDKFKNYNIKTYKAVSGSIFENIKKFEDGNLGELKKEDIS
jgi:predicted Fe-Mo cluster-binding NifX family protein